MLKDIQYALMIDTRKRDAEGAPVTNEVVGLYDSSFCWVTGTPGLDGSETPVGAPENPLTLGAQAVWKEGVIAKGSLGKPGMSVDISTGGGYSSMSGMEAKIMNVVPGLGMFLGEYLRQQEIILHRCEMRVYQIIDGEFFLVNSFVIEDVGEDDNFLSIQCADLWLQVHKEFPTLEINAKSFPTAPEDVQGQMIPLCIGRIPHAKLIPLNGPVHLAKISALGDVEFDAAIILAAEGWPNGARKLHLWARNKEISANQFQDHYLRIVRAGSGSVDYNANVVQSNTKTNGPTNGRVFVVTLRDPFVDGSGLTVQPGSGLGPNAWYVQIYKQTNYRVVSEQPVEQFVGERILGWDETSFIDISEKKLSAHPGGTGYGGLAGMLVRPEGEYKELQAQRWFPIQVDDISLGTPAYTASNYVGSSGADSAKFESFPYAVVSGRNTVDTSVTLMENGYPEVSGSIGNVNDSEAEYHRQILGNARSGNPEYFDAPLLDFRLFPDFILGSDEALFLALDADIHISQYQATSGTASLECIVYLLDVLGNGLTTPLSVSMLVPTSISQGDTKSVAKLTSNTPVALQSDGFLDALRNKETLRLARCIRIIPRTRIRLTGQTGQLRATTTLRGIQLYRTSDAYEGDQYAPVIGATFGSTWGERRNAADPVVSIPDAVEYIMRVQDGAGHLVDTNSFDFTLGKARQLPYWHVGRQILERANSVEYIEELCKHGFCCVVPGRDGKRRLLPIDGYFSFDNTLGFTFDTSFNEQNIIQGSFKDSQIVGMDRVYTGLSLKYDFNPASEEYRKTITVRETDQEAFPAEEAMFGDSDIPLWTTFVGGVTDYSTAKAIWGVGEGGEIGGYRRAYLIAQRENTHEIECPWFVCNDDFEGLGSMDAAVYLAQVLSKWFSVPRVNYGFRVAATEQNLGLYLLQRIYVKDVIRTSGAYYMAIITSLELDPATSEIEVSCQRLLTDKPYIPPEYIQEVHSGDTLTELSEADLLHETVHL